ncbi:MULTISPECIES: hypothetical protein [Sphingomonadaceae]|jgi:enoyl-CoA hydratase/carnithine racemase|uniref:Enoyl-CoA hydratase/carnithine racemase n=2 Tax=Sphingomonadaceae TaxID=41297 RepID=A0A841JB70_9SPHN|nr:MULTISPECIES: hypothetical protein [Sphingomonadaceae]MBB6125735.1 enoyl-CoA hydratase/carnithine racemase [Sphingobium subterraneum]OAN54222.1 hypothetical protein A7Q26_24235 [Sphingobium sp. TCM1]BBF72381.1 hypothetical protein SBA_pBAR2_130 [Sphingomonas bisphenolicum]|tara:strand:+ start:7063 stop:7248 length:186 start_codon:yes stop_codon:yes gene_type:complete
MRIGLTPDMALPFWLARRVGPHAARRIILQDQPVASDRALKLELCDQVVEGGERECERRVS